jgi:type VI secretion system protein ImpM
VSSEADADAVRVGFYGKLPSRGDFLRVGLSRMFCTAWDGWLQEVMPPSREAFDVALRSAPAWHFAFGAGACGPHAACGLLLPSADRVGRVFPLLIAAEAARSSDAFLDAAEQIGIAAINGSLSPEALAQQLGKAARPLPPCASGGVARWWRRAGSGPARELLCDGLPDAGTFLDMLGA